MTPTEITINLSIMIGHSWNKFNWFFPVVNVQMENLELLVKKSLLHAPLEGTIALKVCNFLFQNLFCYLKNITIYQQPTFFEFRFRMYCHERWKLRMFMSFGKNWQILPRFHFYFGSIVHWKTFFYELEFRHPHSFQH